MLLARWAGCSLLLLSGFACSSAHDGIPEPTTPTVVTSSASGGTAAPTPEPSEECERGWVAREGAFHEDECVPRSAGTLDLREDWTPGVFAEAEGGTPEYRATYLELAHGPTPSAAFGVMPSFAAARARLANEERHECHRAVDDTALLETEGELRGWRRDRERQRDNERLLERLKAREEPNDRSRARIAELEPEVLAIRAVKAHLRCEGEELDEDAVLDHDTLAALENFQRRNFLLTTRRVDPDAREWLAMDPEDREFRALLRVLRERVAEGSGLLADGTAANAHEEVLGRFLEGAAVRTPPRPAPLPRALPDHVSRATEAAATALGWTSPSRALTRLRELPERVVRFALPFAWRSDAALPIRVEIDRGDVWYDDPYTSRGTRRSQPVENLPTITIFAELEGEWRPLVRWPTTIGGWMKEQRNHHVALRYEESPVGPVVWRDLVVAPVWMPPPGIPDESLIRRVEGEWVADRSVVGPGPDSAYGLAMLVHHQVREAQGEDEEPRFIDRGIRVHGTGNLASVVDGDRDSHGCHRTFPHWVLRLTDFLLHHHPHERRGEVEVRYSRRLRDGGRRADLDIDSRGFRIELTPPIEVEVTEGTIRGDRRSPIDGLRPLPGRR